MTQHSKDPFRNPQPPIPAKKIANKESARKEPGKK